MDVDEDGTVWEVCGVRFSRRDAAHRHLKKRLEVGGCKAVPKSHLRRASADFKGKDHFEEERLRKWRMELPAAEKNRLAATVLKDIKVLMF